MLSGKTDELDIYRGKVLICNQLLEDMHHDNSLIIDRNIDVYVASLREKLGIDFLQERLNKISHRLFIIETVSQYYVDYCG